MAIRPDYTTGTITLTNGSADVTGTGTAFVLAPVRAGDTIFDIPGATEFEAVISTDASSNTALTLTRPWEGPTLTNVAYRLRFQPDGSRYTATATRLMEILTNGNVEAFNSLDGEADKMIVFTAPGALALIDKSDLVNGAHYDEQVDTLPDRALYDLKEKGFGVLVSDTGDGRSAIYIKQSDDNADWSEPAYLTGPASTVEVGDTTTGAFGSDAEVVPTSIAGGVSLAFTIPGAAQFEAGDTTTLAPGSDATFSLTPVTNGYAMNVGLPAGEGFYYKGSFNVGTAYGKDDVVTYLGSTYIATQSTIGNVPTNVTYWDLLAAKGANGEGAGDVVGPAVSVAGHLAGFADTSGKLLEDSGLLFSDVATHSYVAAQIAAIPSSAGVLNVSDIYPTKAAMDAVTGAADDTIAMVPVTSGMGVYSSKAGAWSKVAEVSSVIINGACTVRGSVAPNASLLIGPNALLSLATGVTLDFVNAQPAILGESRTFALTGTAAVANLQVSNLGWFAGHLQNTTTDYVTLGQKWADSVVNGGLCLIPAGFYSSAGTTYIMFAKGQRVMGASKVASSIRFTGTATAGFRWTSGGGSLSHVSFVKTAEFTIPTSGICMQFDGDLWSAENVSTSGVYGSLQASKVGKLNSFDFNDSKQFGINFTAHADSFASNGIITATSAWVTLGTRTGTFVNGETVTWTGSGSGNNGVTFTDGAGLLHKSIFGGKIPPIGTVLTGSTSGAKGTVTAITHPHQDGGIEIFGYAQAHLFTNIDVVGGRIGLNCAGTANNINNQPFACTFNGVLFDSAREQGIFLNMSINIKFVNCFCSNRPTAGADIYIVNSKGVEFIGHQWNNNWQGCMLVDTGVSVVTITGGTISDFNVSNTAIKPAFEVASGNTVLFNGVKLLPSSGFGGFSTVGLKIASGAKVTATDCDFALCTTPVSDLGGDETVLTRIKGWRTENRGVGNLATGASSVVITHGLKVAPPDVFVLLQALTNPATVGGGQLYVSNMTATTFTVGITTAITGGSLYFFWRVQSKDWVS